MWTISYQIAEQWVKNIGTKEEVQGCIESVIFSNDGYSDDNACWIYDAEFNEWKWKGELVLRVLKTLGKELQWQG